MGRYKKYRSDKALREAVEAYFAGISRTVDVMEERKTGEKDDWGHFVKEWVPVCNDKGEVIRAREFVIPPTAGGLCAHLEISRETWAKYCDKELNPQFEETTTWARGVLRGYLEGQLLTRGGKDLKGVIFSLQNNYGYAEKRTVELGPKAAQAVAAGAAGSAEREALLRLLAEEDADELPDAGFGETGADGEGGSGELRVDEHGAAADGSGDPAVVEEPQTDQQ